jgi:hypothetical protein
MDFNEPLQNLQPQKTPQKIPDKAQYFDHKNNVMVKKEGLVLSWEDNEGLYKATFPTELQAWESYLYWCKTT